MIGIYLKRAVPFRHGELAFDGFKPGFGIDELDGLVGGCVRRLVQRTGVFGLSGE